MAITFPINLLDDFPGWSTNFELMYRQEQSRHANGRTRVKDFGTPIWQATYVSKNLRPNELDRWRAKLNSLENGLNTFVAYPKSRCWPIKHPNGININETGLVNSLNVNNKALSLKGVPSLQLSIGDYISVENKLYQVMEDTAITGGGGTTAQFEIRPHLSLTTGVNDIVKLYQPSCLMTLVPGSVSYSSGLNGRGSISFNGLESRG